jgi:hypothetical protein
MRAVMLNRLTLWLRYALLLPLFACGCSTTRSVSCCRVIAAAHQTSRSPRSLQQQRTKLELDIRLL